MKTDSTSQEVKSPPVHVVPVEPVRDAPETVGESCPAADEPFEGYKCSDY